LAKRRRKSFSHEIGKLSRWSISFLTFELALIEHNRIRKEKMENIDFEISVQIIFLSGMFFSSN